jgi:hypothetical protein
MNPSIKEVDKFFKYAINSLVSSVQFRELTTWQQLAVRLMNLFNEKFPKAKDNIEVIYDTEKQLTPVEAKSVIEDTRNRYIKSLAAATLVTTALSQPTTALSPSVQESVSQPTIEKEAAQLPVAEVLPAQATIIDKKAQKKAHRRYNNWYARVPEEDLKENGGIIPPLDTTKQEAELRYFQVDAAAHYFKGFVRDNKRAQLLRAGVGVGKTYIIGQLLRWLWDTNFHVGPVHSLFPYMVVTKAPIVTQTERVLRDKFGLPVGKYVGGVLVTNYDQLRASLGDIMIQWHTQIVNGEEVLFPVWRDTIHPCVIVWDECQALKNTGSTQTEIARAYSRIADKKITEADMVKHPCWTVDNCKLIHGDNSLNYLAPNTWQLFSSATPFTTVEEAKTFALATRAEVGSEDMVGYKGD